MSSPTFRTTPPASHSFVLEEPPAPPEEARCHFAAKLSVECDPADLKRDLERGTARLVVIDARSARDFDECHIPGAVNLPYRSITAETMTQFPEDVTFVTYCWGPSCNASTRAAYRISALGLKVKELIGGIEYWRREGHPVEGILGNGTGLT